MAGGLRRARARGVPAPGLPELDVGRPDADPPRLHGDGAARRDRLPLRRGWRPGRTPFPGRRRGLRPLDRDLDAVAASAPVRDSRRIGRRARREDLRPRGGGRGSSAELGRLLRSRHERLVAAPLDAPAAEPLRGGPVRGADLRLRRIRRGSPRRLRALRPRLGGVDADPLDALPPALPRRGRRERRGVDRRGPARSGRPRARPLAVRLRIPGLGPEPRADPHLPEGAPPLPRGRGDLRDRGERRNAEPPPGRGLRPGRGLLVRLRELPPDPPLPRGRRAARNLLPPLRRRHRVPEPLRRRGDLPRPLPRRRGERDRRLRRNLRDPRGGLRVPVDLPPLLPLRPPPPLPVPLPRPRRARDLRARLPARSDLPVVLGEPPPPLGRLPGGSRPLRAERLRPVARRPRPGRADPRRHGRGDALGIPRGGRRGQDASMAKALPLLALLLGQDPFLDPLTSLGEGRPRRASSASPDADSNRDNLRIPPGETRALAELKGPGVIRHIWITFPEARPGWLAEKGGARPDEIVLRIFWDGAPSPAVESPVGDFFACGFGERREVRSIPVQVEEGDSYNAFWPMPFARSAKVTLE